MPRFFKKPGCQEIKEQLSAYIDGQLTSSEKSSIEEHLAFCKPCQEELASLRATKRILGHMPSAAASRSFAIVSYRPARRVPAFDFLRLATAVVAILLILVGLGDFWNVYPKAPLPAPPAPVTAPLSTPPATPVPPVTTPEPQPTPPPPVSKIREAPLGPSVSATQAPVPVEPGPTGPGEAAPEPAVPKEPIAVVPEGTPSTSAEVSDGDYIWPVREIERWLLVAVVVLFVLTIVARQLGYARIKW